MSSVIVNSVIGQELNDMKHAILFTLWLWGLWGCEAMVARYLLHKNGYAGDYLVTGHIASAGPILIGWLGTVAVQDLNKFKKDIKKILIKFFAWYFGSLLVSITFLLWWKELSLLWWEVVALYVLVNTPLSIFAFWWNKEEIDERSCSSGF